MKFSMMILCLSLAGCASIVTPVRTISYPWRCEMDKTSPCTRLGYEISTDEPADVVEAANLCSNGAKSLTSDTRRHKTLIVCK